MVPTEGQRNQVVPSSHARQSPNYACFDGNRLSARPGNRYLYALWEMSVAAWRTGCYAIPMEFQRKDGSGRWTLILKATSIRYRTGRSWSGSGERSPREGAPAHRGLPQGRGNGERQRAGNLPKEALRKGRFMTPRTHLIT